jgi:hypothetical protein
LLGYAKGRSVPPEGETTVQVAVSGERMARWAPAGGGGGFVQEPGDYEVWVADATGGVGNETPRGFVITP